MIILNMTIATSLSWLVNVLTEIGTASIPLGQIAAEEAFGSLTCTPGLALAAFLLALVELVVLALAVFYVLMRLDEQRLSRVQRMQDLVDQHAAPAVSVDRPTEGGEPPPSPGPLMPQLPVSTGAASRKVPGELLTNHPKEQSPLPSVVVSTHLIPEIYEYVAAFLDEHGQQNEAGAVLVGEYHKTEPSPGFQVSGFIPAGPKASFSAGSILFDTEWQTRVLTAIRIAHPSVDNIGMIHRHPGQFDRCSGGDEVADLDAVLESPSKGLVFAIITIGNPKQDPLSVYHKDFKIDFFVMSEGTGFKYVKIAPVFADIPLVKACPAMVALCENGRAPTAYYDFAVLRHLGAKVSVRLAKDDGATVVVCTVSLRDAGCDISVLCQADGALRVSVHEPEAPILEINGPWEQPDIGRHVWLAHLVTTILAQRRSRAAACRDHCSTTGLRHPLLDNKNRLVAEVRAMQQKYGDRAVLKLLGQELGWEYTLRESGRVLPVRILYPYDYPDSPPRILSTKKLPSSPHQLGGNEICWTDRWSSDSEWNPARDTAVVCVAAAHRWFACLLVYLTTGQWPDGAEG